MAAKRKPKHKVSPGKSSGSKATPSVGRGKGKSRPVAKKAPAKAKKQKGSKPKAQASKAKVKGKATVAAQRARDKAQRLREQKLKAKAAAELKKERDRERVAKQKERERAAKEKAQLKKQHERDKIRQAKERQKLSLQQQKAKQAELKRKEAELAAAKKAALAERARKVAARKNERERLAKERLAAKIQQRKDRDAERLRQKAAKAAEKERAKAEREAERIRLRDEAQRKKEDEAAARKAAQDSYRKAKETEKSRIRAEREAARRALEGRVAKAAGRGLRGGVARSGSGVRVYTPTAIPNQSGTRRGSGDQDSYAKFANLRPPRPDGQLVPETPPTRPPPPAPEAPPERIEDRYALILERLGKADEAFRREYEDNLLMSWIYHDSALEGVVYTYDELRAAINPNITVVPDSSMQSVVDEVRRHKAAIDLVRELGDKKRAPVTIDVVRRLYLVLHPEEGDLKTVKYRKDIPQHRLYFHEYAAPDKIAHKVRQVFDWLNGPEPKKLKSPIKVAARVHYDLLRVFPFTNDSGKVARLLLNILLLRSDCPPAIIHSAERQRYYEALRGSLVTIVSMVQESIMNALQSIEKKLDEHETRTKAFVS